MKREYKDNITIDDVKSGEVIKTNTGKYYLVIKLNRLAPDFVEVNLSRRQKNIEDKIEAVFGHNGFARILPTDKEI